MRARKLGRPPTFAVLCIMRRFGVSKKVVRLANWKQIVKCTDNAVIRMLLGISR